MPLTLNNTNTVSADNISIDGKHLDDLYATIEYVDSKVSSAGGGITEQQVDDKINPVDAKADANTASIATLNTKQLQNFNNITAINDDLTNNYQTNTVLASNFYNKSEIDTTLGNYYTSLVIDNGFYTQTQINNNFYTKTETDDKIDNLAVYSQTEVDAFLSYKEDKTRFVDNISFFPIIDCSRPTILHQGLTLKNSTVNVEPLEGVLFSNQFGAEADRDVAVFKNQTNYITLKGNKINAYNTSDDSIAELELNNNGQCNFNDLRINNNFFCYADMTVSSLGFDLVRPSGNTTYTLRVRDYQGIWEFRNRTLTCRNSSNENLDTLMEIQSLGQGQVRIGTASTAQVGIGTTPNASYYLSVGGTSNFDIARIATRLDLIGDLYVSSTGADIVRSSGDSNYTLRVKDGQAVWEFRNRKFNCLNPSDPDSFGSEMVLQDTPNGDNRVRIGSTSSCRVGIGANSVIGYYLTVGGTSQFQEVIVNQNLSVAGSEFIGTKSKLFQRADASNSFNVISEKEINFSLQSDRGTDPTTGTIALQLHDTNGITINRAVTNNQTFNSLGNITAEATLNVWGDLNFQHSSGIKETLNGSDYDLDIRNGDTDRSINMIVGTVGSTPEISISEASVNLLGNLDITHSTVSTSEKVKFDNPDSDGEILMSINNTNTLGITNAGVDVYGVLTGNNAAVFTHTLTCSALIETSDKKLKENIKEVNDKECYRVVNYIRPKTFNLISDENKRSDIGFIADDFKDIKMPKEWDNVVFENEKNLKLLAYNKTSVILWGAVRELIREKDELTDLVKVMKKEMATMKGEITKLKKSKDF